MGLLDFLLTKLVMHVARKEGEKDPEFRKIVNNQGEDLKKIKADIQKSLDKIDELNKKGIF